MLDTSMEGNTLSIVLDSEKEGMVRCPVTKTESADKCLEIENENTEFTSLSLRKQIMENGVLQLRIIHTVLIAWACFAVGWRLAMVGPTFPDLLQIIDVDVSVGSWLLTAFYIGNVTGSLAAGCLYDRFSKLAVIISCMILLSFSSALIPWCTSFTQMLVAHIVSGASYGASDVVTITDVSHVWDSNSAPMLQLTQCVYSIGAIIAPLVAVPFLAERHNGLEELALTMNNLTNLTNGLIENQNQSKLIENRTLTSNINTGNISDPRSERLYKAYLITALISFVNAAAFILYSVVNKNVYRKFARKANSCKSESRKNNGHRFSKRTKFCFVCSLALLLMLHLLVERNFVSYFTSYVSNKRGWSKTAGSAATSVYYVAAAMGRLIASPILACISLTKAMAVYIALATVALLGIFTATYIDASFMIWTSVVILGFSIGPLFTAWFSWLSENVVLTSGRITGTMYLIGVSACCFLPPLIGYLMETYTYDWLIYILLVLDTLMVIMFCAVVYVHRILTSL